MKTKMIQVQEGELLGPIDWNYDFLQHDWNHGGGTNPDSIQRGIKFLKILTDGKKYKASIYSDKLMPVLAVGMYDGWPYWKPTPSILLHTWLGEEWHPFMQITKVEKQQKENYE